MVLSDGYASKILISNDNSKKDSSWLQIFNKYQFPRVMNQYGHSERILQFMGILSVSSIMTIRN